MACVAFHLRIMCFIQKLLLMAAELPKRNELVNHEITPEQAIICTSEEEFLRLRRI